MRGMVATPWKKPSEHVCVLVKVSVKGPGDVLPADGVVDEAEAELSAWEGPPDL